MHRYVCGSFAVRYARFLFAVPRLLICVAIVSPFVWIVLCAHWIRTFTFSPHAPTPTFTFARTLDRSLPRNHLPLPRYICDRLRIFARLILPFLHATHTHRCIVAFAVAFALRARAFPGSARLCRLHLLRCVAEPRCLRCRLRLRYAHVYIYVCASFAAHALRCDLRLRLVVEFYRYVTIVAFTARYTCVVTHAFV